jgi:hypothetical protein
VSQKAYLTPEVSEKKQEAGNQEQSSKQIEKKEKQKEFKVQKGGDLIEKKEQLKEIRGQIGNKLKEIDSYDQAVKKGEKVEKLDPGRLGKDLKDAFVEVKKEKQKMGKEREKNKDKNKRDRRND